MLKILHQLRGQDCRIELGLVHTLIPGPSSTDIAWTLAPNKGLAASSEISLNSSISVLSNATFCGSNRRIARIATVWFAKRIGMNAWTLDTGPERSRPGSTT